MPLGNHTTHNYYVLNQQEILRNIKSVDIEYLGLMIKQ